jgi:hypothetical protein
MTLLATSTPEHRNPVRILFYGQSITEQKWWKDVADDLRRRFPYADLTIENRAIGGFAAQVLVRPAEHDLYPFYPDLLIFYVYGDHTKYEEIIANTRRRTTAEIITQTEHVAVGDQWWPEKMSTELIPQIAQKYGCELANIRAPWKRYLKDNNLDPQKLLSDNVHLNDHGNFLMAELMKWRLRYSPSFPTDAWKGLVRTFVVGKDLNWKDSRIVLEFDGNRIDAIAARPAPGQGRSARVLIDGKKPSEFPELYVITRPSATQAGFWPGVIRVSWQKPLTIEDWTARITETNDDPSLFKFDVLGSKTGFDGTGVTDKRFVSNSGRVVIEPEDWWFKRARDFSGKALPVGFEVKWQVKPMFLDVYAPPSIQDPTRECATTLAQSLVNDKHTLEIVADGGTSVPISALRVYRPPFK